MNGHDALIGRHVPGHSWLHRIPVGPKWWGIFVLTLAALLIGQWWASAALVVMALGLLLSARVPVGMALWVGWGFTVLVVVIAAYQWWRGSPAAAVVVAGNLVGCLWLSRVLTMTTPVSDLVDAVTRGVQPLARIGVPAERIGLAVGLVVRSVPYLVGSFADVRDAARARGLERNWFARITPVVIGAVAYAQRTGDALTARGLGDDASSSASDS